jgi:hypothetical protein
MIYRQFSRERNQEAIRRLLHPSDPQVMQTVSLEYMHDFHPSLFAEIDWQELRPDVSDPNLRQILGFIDDYLFFATTLSSISQRTPGGTKEALTEDDITSFRDLFTVWQQDWFGPNRVALLGQLDRFIETIRRPYWKSTEAAITADTECAISTALDRLTDIRRLPHIMEVILCNARFRYLDLPWTRRRAKAALRLQISELGDLSIMGAADSGSRCDPQTIQHQLMKQAAIADRVGCDGWAALLKGSAAALDLVKPAGLDRDEGEWSLAMTPCARCSMWFAFDTLSSIDTRCSFVNWSNRGLVFIPAGIGTAQCPFCGLAAPVDAPMMFYAEHRSQVVYLAPTKGLMPENEGVDFWRRVIEGIRDRYRRRLDAGTRARFETASELVTHNIRDFLYAVQMGETISEDHVFNLIELADGTGLVWDGEKRFARVITPGELEWHKCTGNLEMSGTSPETAYKTISDSIPQSQRNQGNGDPVEKLIGHLADRNDAIDAILAERRRRHA